MQQIVPWFLEHRKSYPWRENKTPYRVWVSEVMLQQTRAEVVLPYFEKWMQIFPTVEDLAQAHQDEVIKIWEGLGYYSRARNLHKAAQEIVEEFGGNLPDSALELLKIKGIGPYTAGAISSFAYEKRCAFVDGNIARVMARFYGFEKCVIKHTKSVTELVEKSLPEKQSHHFMEGLIELGQQVCKKKPDCTLCPLKQSCFAYKQERQNDLPVRKVKSEVIKLDRLVALILCNDTLLVKKNEKGKVMGDLWEFPYVESVKERSVTQIKDAFDFPLELDMILPAKEHTFTKYKVKLYPYLFQAQEKAQVEGYEWVDLKDVEGLPFSSGHRRIKEHLFSEIISYN